MIPVRRRGPWRCTRWCCWSRTRGERNPFFSFEGAPLLFEREEKTKKNHFASFSTSLCQRCLVISIRFRWNRDRDKSTLRSASSFKPWLTSLSGLRESFCLLFSTAARNLGLTNRKKSRLATSLFLSSPSTFQTRALFKPFLCSKTPTR